MLLSRNFLVKFLTDSWDVLNGQKSWSCIVNGGVEIKPRKIEESETEVKVQVGETIDILDILFTDSSDFLVKYNGQKVKFDDLNGKTIVLFMSSLVAVCPHIVTGTKELLEAYNELRPQDSVEFVFVPKIKRQTDYDCSKCLFSEEECFNNLFSKMPWPAVPFSDKRKRHRIETIIWPYSTSNRLYFYPPRYIIFDPKGKIILANRYAHKPWLSVFNLYGGADLFSLADPSQQNLEKRDQETLNTLNLDQLLASAHRDFLLASDGTEVPVFSLRYKVVGLYFCDNVPTPPPRMELLKKVYREAMHMGYDFEIVQINLHFRNHYKKFPYNEEMPLQVWCQDVPWLTLPYKDVCCRRLRRLFKLHEKLRYWEGDSLVVIDPHGSNINGSHYERYAIHLMEHFGIEAYPFTRERVVELEYAELRQVKLHTIFPLDGPPLIRPSASRGCDQVPRSKLFGRPIYVLFSPHFKYTEKNYIDTLESQYRSQPDDEGKFEVVYISCGRDESTFDEFIKEMPWLVHPYSWELGERWISKFAKSLFSPSALFFNANGELEMHLYTMLNYIATVCDVEDENFSSYPYE